MHWMLKKVQRTFSFRKKKRDEKLPAPALVPAGSLSEGVSSESDYEISPEPSVSNKAVATPANLILPDEPEVNVKASMALVELSRATPLRARDIADVTTAVVNDAKGVLVAQQTIIKYTPSQAYSVLSEYSPSLYGKAVKVEGTDTKLKLISIQDEREDRRLLPIVVQFHTLPEARSIEAHLSDVLAEGVLGRFNLELKKNVTIDSFTESDTLRDEAGFIVTDRNRFELVTFDSDKLRASLLPPVDVAIVEYTPSELDALTDFDHSVCGFNREQTIEYIAANATVLLAKGNGGVDGMLAAKDGHIMALYAETIEIAHTLINKYIQTKKVIQVQLFTRTDVWECPPSSSRPVYRRHTRAVPSCIKWSKVYALNMGVHIV